MVGVTSRPAARAGEDPDASAGRDRCRGSDRRTAGPARSRDDAAVLDDFGTGYASLSYLLQLPFDKIKIDRSFITDLSARGDARPIIEAVVSLATNLGMATTAEGVETAEQWQLLSAIGLS